MNYLRLALVLAIIGMAGLVVFSQSYSGDYKITLVILTNNDKAPNPTEQWAYSIQNSQGAYWNAGHYPMFLASSEPLRVAYIQSWNNFAMLTPDNYTVQVWQLEISPDGQHVWAIPWGNPVEVSLNGNHLVTFFGNATGVAIP